MFKITTHKQMFLERNDVHSNDMAEWFDMLIANAIENGMFPNIFNTVGVTTNEEV